MQTHYSPLLNLRFRHDYFPQSDCPAISVIPTVETSHTMQHLGIKMIAREFGMECFYNDGVSPGGQLLQVDAPVRLSFVLRSKEASFLNYTELSLSDSPKHLQYFTNLQTDGSSATFTASQATTLPTRPALFTVKANQPGEVMKLVDELGNQLYHTSAETSDDYQVIQPTNEDASEFRIDLSKEPAGRYFLWEGDTLLLDFVLLPQNWQPGDLGLFSAYAGETRDNKQIILAEGAVTPASYLIEFAARSTIWRFHLIDNGEPGNEGFQLVDQASQRVIASSSAPPDTRILPDGSEAIVLATPSPIPLRLRPGHLFTLSMKSKGSARSSPTTIPLPSADASRLSRAQPHDRGNEEENSFYSDIYVYL